VTYAWDFGDGETSTEAVIRHSFAAAGTYPVRLTVVDPGGLADTLTRQLTVGEPPATPVTFRAAASSNTITSRPSVTIPSTVQAGDVMVLFATTNRNATMTTPTGWTSRGSRLDGTDLESWAFTRVAPTGAAGSRVTTTLDASSKVSLTVLAYAGGGPVVTAAAAGETVTRATHQSPPVPVAVAGSFVVSHWVDRTAGHAGWTLPATVAWRNANAGTGAAQLEAVSGDSGPIQAGTWSGATATSGVASGKALSWSVVVPPA
jgi:PKD repeat protein